MLSLCVTICRSALSWVGGQHWERLCICPWAFSGSSSSTKKSPPWPAVSGSSSRETRSTSLGQPEWLHPSLSCGRSWWDSFTDDVVQPEPQTGFGVFFFTPVSWCFSSFAEFSGPVEFSETDTTEFDDFGSLTRSPETPVSEWGNSDNSSQDNLDRQFDSNGTAAPEAEVHPPTDPGDEYQYNPQSLTV